MKNNRLLSLKRGYSLVEMAIVLVIVGALAAGILTGRDLMRAAEIRAQTSQIQELNGAVLTFKDKYSCLPGDCAEASNFKLTTNTNIGTATNGNGNGTLNNGFQHHFLTLELVNFWLHLSRAGLIKGEYKGFDTNDPTQEEYETTPGIASPPLKMSGSGVAVAQPTRCFNPKGGIWVTSVNSVNQLTDILKEGHAWWLAGRVGCEVNHGDGSAIYLPQDAYALDVKMDDGRPQRGIVKSIGAFFNPPPYYWWGWRSENSPTYLVNQPIDGRYCIKNTPYGLKDNGHLWEYNLNSKGPPAAAPQMAYCSMFITAPF